MRKAGSREGQRQVSGVRGTYEAAGAHYILGAGGCSLRVCAAVAALYMAHSRATIRHGPYLFG